MSDRWMALVAALVGLVGGVGGAAIGGYIANEGQEQRFREERQAEIRDARRASYVEFLRAAEDEHLAGPATEDRLLRAAEAEVELVTSREDIRRAANALTLNALEFTTEAEYARLRERFIELAHADAGAG